MTYSPTFESAVIKKPQKELNNASDIHFEYKEIYIDKEVVAINFIISHHVEYNQPIKVVSENNFYDKWEKEEKEAKKLSTSELKEKIRNNNHSIPKRINITASKFNRNPYVAEYAKRVASGICQDCNQPAPFVSRLTNEPFLETHHIIPLAQGGTDTIENTIAICPNCHRKRHYG